MPHASPWRAHKEQLLSCDTDSAALGQIRHPIFLENHLTAHTVKKAKQNPGQKSQVPRSPEPPGTQAWRTCRAPCTGMCTPGERTGLPCLCSKLGSRICGQQAMARGCRYVSQEWPSVPFNLSISLIHRARAVKLHKGRQVARERGWEEQRQSQVQPGAAAWVRK